MKAPARTASVKVLVASMAAFRTPTSSARRAISGGSSASNRESPLDTSFGVLIPGLER
jgi:hypothetical protein